MSDGSNPAPGDPTETVFKVQVVSSPRSVWSVLVDRIKEVSVVFTAGFAALNFVLPQTIKDEVAIWWAALDAPRADLVEPMLVEAVVDGPPTVTGWVFAGTGSASQTAPDWVFGQSGDEIAVGETLKPLTDVNVRTARITGLNASPDIIDILMADGTRCVRVLEVDPSQRTPSVWIFGEIVEC
ncbi:hypothetical protein [uncultured Tateyamaria sp.]|uniref:hypothetical protein n=1 Tax=Tateyamaria sp. 1078 TaxID=3417464 RepID=UPI00262C523C|nr:hypothetical protein [uncultured Tateyamaria sp.]